MADFADGYALRALMESESGGGGGGDEPQNLKWERPAEWPEMPEPAENEWCVLIAFPESETENKYYEVNLNSTSLSVPISEISMNIDWGDGNSEIINGHSYVQHNYSSDSTFRIVKVSINVSDKFQITLQPRQAVNPTLYTLECFLGKNVGISAINQVTVLHIKTFGWTPTSITDNFINLGSSSSTIHCFETITPWEYIPNRMFYGCRSLFDFDFSKVKEIGENSIYDCDLLRIIDVPLCTNLANRAITYNNSLIKVNLPSCISIGNYGCSNNPSLTEVNIPLVQTVGEYCFQGNYSLSKISLENISKIPRDCFNNNYALSEINIPNVITIELNAFEYNYGLSKISLPKCQEIQQNAFYQCAALISIDAPMCENVGDSAFNSCYALYEINFSDSVVYGNGVFTNCSFLGLKFKN